MFLYQQSDGYLFNSDTHFLYSFLTRFNPKGELLDVGCGCGILGLLSVRDFPISLTQIDKQKHNIFLSEKNAQVNTLKSDAIEGDFLTYNFDKKFDFIISNPPYYHDGVSKSKNKILHISRYSMHLPIEDFFKKVNRSLNNRGHFIFCYAADEIQKLLISLKESKMQVEDLQFVHGTKEKVASVVLIHARKNSLSKTKTHPPLINIKDAQASDDVNAIYQKTRTYSIKCNIL